MTLGVLLFVIINIVRDIVRDVKFILLPIEQIVVSARSSIQAVLISHSFQQVPL